MIGIFELSTCRTERALRRVAAMDCFPIRKKQMDPFENEPNLVRVPQAKALEKVPVDMFRICPGL